MPPALAQVLVLGLVLALLTWWFQRRLVRAVGLPRGYANAATISLAVLAVCTLVGFETGSLLDPGWARPVALIGMTWVGVAFYLILGLSAIGLTCLGARLGRRLRGRPARPEAPSRRRVLQAATGTLTLTALATVGFGVASAARPTVKRSRISLRRLPNGFDGVTVAFVSDLHVGPTRGAALTRRVAELVAAERPDLIVLGGDLVDGTVEHVGADLRPLARLRAPLGVFGVSGNHEYYADDGESWMRFWTTLGIRPLRNERVALRRGGDTIDLAGIFDATAEAPHEPDLATAVRGRDPDRFLLLAAHQPAQVEQAREHGVDLQLSGHTHGGQIWPFDLAVRLEQPMVDGLARFDDTLVYATRGAGAWGPPVRVGAPPEVTLLKLVREG